MFQSFKEEISTHPYFHVGGFFFFGLSAVADLQSVGLSFFWGAIAYGVAAALGLWVAALFSWRFLARFFRSESGAVPQRFSIIGFVLLGLCVALGAPFGRAAQAFFWHPSPLCEINQYCTGWLRVGEFDFTDRPTNIDSPFKSLMPNLGAQTYDGFCPEEVFWPMRRKIGDGSRAYPRRVSVWWPLREGKADRSAVDDALAYIPNRRTVLSTCEENAIGPSCTLVRDEVQLAEDDKIQVLGCASQPKDNGYSLIWLKVRDPKFRRAP